MNKIICQTCFSRVRDGGINYCNLIENENGGNMEANLTECEHYLKKGTEPLWLCCMCGKNTYGGSLTIENGKYYCDSCYWKKEAKEKEEKDKIKYKRNIEKISCAMGCSLKKAEEVLKLID